MLPCLGQHRWQQNDQEPGWQDLSQEKLSNRDKVWGFALMVLFSLVLYLGCCPGGEDEPTA